MKIRLKVIRNLFILSKILIIKILILNKNVENAIAIRVLITLPQSYKCLDRNFFGIEIENTYRL